MSCIPGSLLIDQIQTVRLLVQVQVCTFMTIRGIACWTDQAVCGVSMWGMAARRLPMQSLIRPLSCLISVHGVIQLHRRHDWLIGCQASHLAILIIFSIPLEVLQQSTLHFDFACFTTTYSAALRKNILLLVMMPIMAALIFLLLCAASRVTRTGWTPSSTRFISYLLQTATAVPGVWMRQRSARNLSLNWKQKSLRLSPNVSPHSLQNRYWHQAV